METLTPPHPLHPYLRVLRPSRGWGTLTEGRLIRGTPALGARAPGSPLRRLGCLATLVGPPTEDVAAGCSSRGSL